MGEVLTAVLVFGSAAVAWCVALRGTERRWWPPRWLTPLVRWRRREEPEPEGRPIEAIAADLRRLARRFRCPQEGARFAKIEGYRRAYDAVLTEACDALGLCTLLGVLPPGRELDAERDRVEDALGDSGLSLEVWR